MGEAPTLILEPPEIDLHGGYFIVTCQLTGVCRAYPPSVYFATLAKMGEVGRKFNFAGADILPFKAETALYR